MTDPVISENFRRYIADVAELNGISKRMAALEKRLQKATDPAEMELIEREMVTLGEQRVRYYQRLGEGLDVLDAEGAGR